MSVLAAGAALALPCAAVAAPKAEVRGDLPDDLRDRVERAVGDTDDAADNRFQARRRARSAAEDAEAVLRSEGYYGAIIAQDVEGDEAPRAVLTITPGARFLIVSPTLEWTGDTPEAGPAAMAQEAMALIPGSPGRAAEVLAAEGRVVASLTANGYADAVAGDRTVTVDHAATTLQPTFRIVAGQLVILNGVSLRTRGPTNLAWVERLAPWRPGDRYTTESVGELERRLLETGVYDSVAVSLAPVNEATPDGRRPIIVSLSDRPRRILEAGVGVSTSEGFGVDAIWTWYNRFGRADTLRFEFRLAQINSRIGSELSLPHWRRPGRTLKLGAALFDEDTDAYDRTGAGVHADLQQRFGKTSFFSYGVGLEGGVYRERVFDPVTLTPGSLDRNLVILTGRGGASLDRSDDPLNPRRGWRLSVDAQPTVVSGDTSLAFLRLQSQVSAYLPVEDQGRTVIAGRLRLGAIGGGSFEGVPSDRRFFSGGGGSVRGYSYQGVGPRLPDNTPRGGLSLVETSLEVRRDLFGNFGAVVFVDGGAVGDNTAPDFSSVQWSVGAGVRYNLPFGPIRADIAIPLNKRDGDPGFQIYVSIGQAF